MATINASKDAYITDEVPTKALGSHIYWPTGIPAWESLWVGEGSRGNICKFLIDFDLSTIPSNAIVTSAKIRIFQYDGEDDWISSGHPVKLSATLINQTWTDTTVTWNTQPTTDSSYISPETASFYNRISTNVEIDVTAITQRYVSNQSSYYGYMVYYTGTNSETRKQFRSMDYATSTKRPVLIITYTAATPEIPNNPPVWPTNSKIIISPEGVIDSSETSISVSWNTAIDPESDPVYYVVSRRIDNSAGDEVYNGASTSFNDDITELLPGNSIRYNVYATDYSKNSPVLTSNIASISRYTNSSVSYTYLYDTANPNTVRKLIFTNNPAPITNIVYLTFQHNPIADINFLKNQAEATNLALTVQNASLTVQKNNIGNDITNVTTNISMHLTNKASYINTFESNNFSYIKEGLWKESNYVLKRLKTTIINPALTLTATPTTGFMMSIDYHEIDLTSIKLWLMDGDKYLYKYEQYADYDIEYGSYSGSYGIFFKPLVGDEDSGAFKYNVLSGGNDTRLSAVINLYIECSDVSGNVVRTIANSPLGRLTIDSYTRTYDINDFNPQLSSLEIVTQLGRDPLVENTDYTYTINEDNTGTITFKPSQNALHLSNYYSISYYNNITVKSFYADAEDALTKAAYPAITYEISMADLHTIPGFENFIPQVGKKILINDSTLKLNGVYGFISEVEDDLDNPENTKITITNYENIGKPQQILDNGGGF